jgi:Flp pilus assembly protein TadB
MRRHNLWMILGCALPLLLVFLVPLLGISGNVATFLFILLMFACHLLAMHGHGHRDLAHRQKGPHGSH